MRSLQVSEAGDIEQDASIIILLWNLDNEDKTRKGLKVDKNRQGELGKIVYRLLENDAISLERREHKGILGESSRRYRQILQEVPDRVLERISTGTCKRIGKESET